VLLEGDPHVSLSHEKIIDKKLTIIFENDNFIFLNFKMLLL